MDVLKRNAYSRHRKCLLTSEKLTPVDSKNREKFGSQGEIVELFVCKDIVGELKWRMNDMLIKRSAECESN